MNDYSIPWFAAALCAFALHGLTGCKSRNDSEGSVSITSDNGSIKVEDDKGAVTVRGSDKASADEQKVQKDTAGKPADKSAARAQDDGKGSVKVKGADGRPVTVKDEDGVVSVQGDKGLITVKNGKVTVAGDKESVTVGDDKK